MIITDIAFVSLLSSCIMAQFCLISTRKTILQHDNYSYLHVCQNAMNNFLTNVSEILYYIYPTDIIQAKYNIVIIMSCNLKCPTKCMI